MHKPLFPLVSSPSLQRMWVPLFLCFVALWSASGCSKDKKLSAAGESCTKSADCSSELRCVKGTCKAPAAAPKQASGEGAPKAASTGEVKFKYTTSNLSKCKNLHKSPDGGRTDLYRCPGVGPYSLRVGHQDMGSSLQVMKKSRVVFTGPKISAGFVSSKVVEWRYRVVDGSKEVHALIFRMTYPIGDGLAGKQGSRLYVARLTGPKPCLVGKTGSNKTAREYADDPDRACL